MLSTGVTDIVGSEELTDKSGLRGCWGTAMAGNNPEVYDVHTVGLGVCVPKDNYRGDSYFTDGKPSLPNQAYVALVQTETDSLRYCDMRHGDLRFRRQQGMVQPPERLEADNRASCRGQDREITGFSTLAHTVRHKHQPDIQIIMMACQNYLTRHHSFRLSMMYWLHGTIIE